MLLSDERRARIEAVAFDYAGAPKQSVAACNLCGAQDFVVIAESDRYGFPATARCCTRCGLVFLDPMLTADAYTAFYSDVYRPLVSAYHGRRIDAETVEAEQIGYAHALVDELELFLRHRAARTLLDVGGSTGVIAERVATEFGLVATVLDPAPDEVRRAAARGLEATVGTIETWDPEGRRFEVVTLCQTIDHLLDISVSLAKIRTVLAEDGLFFLDIVDFRAAYRAAGRVEAALKVDHPYSLTEPTMEAFLARAGFRVVHGDRAADGLHVNYVAEVAPPQPMTLPPAESVERMLEELGRL